MKALFLLVSLFPAVFLSSCIVQAPKYATIEQVLNLHTGMTQEEVSSQLGIPPYDVKRIDSSTYTLIYKYRTTERNTIPLLMRPSNGIKARGKWVDLFITYSKEGKAISINSCSECGETKVKQTRINFNSIVTFLTLTLPAILIFLKLK